MTKKLLVSTMGVLEIATGLALIAVPSVVARLLLGLGLDAPVGETVGRVAGAALLSLGIICWMEREGAAGRGSRGLIAGMFFYNVAVAAVLVFARTSADLSGIAFWPAVLAHSALAVWIAALLSAARA
jgi:hypothetical protein